MKKLLVTLSIFTLAFSAQVAKKATFSLEKVNQNELQVVLESDAAVYGFDRRFEKILKKDVERRCAERC